MTDYLIRPQAAIDAGTGAIVFAGSGQLYAIADETNTTPLAVTLADGSGALVTSITVAPNGQTQAFYSTEPELRWVSGGITAYLFSVTGMRDAVEAGLASLAGLEATTEASLAAITAQVVTLLGKNPNPNGTIVLLPLDPDPNPALIDDGVLVVRLDPTEV